MGLDLAEEEPFSIMCRYCENSSVLKCAPGGLKADSIPGWDLKSLAQVGDAEFALICDCCIGFIGAGPGCMGSSCCKLGPPLIKLFIICSVPTSPPSAQPLVGTQTRTYLVLRRMGTLAAEAIQLAVRPSADEPITLQRLVILNMFLELAQRVASRGALGSSHKRHLVCQAAIDREAGDANTE